MNPTHTSMDPSNNFHETKPTFINFHGGSKFTTTFKVVPWKLVETSMEVDRMEVGTPLWKSCGSSWKFVILVEIGGNTQVHSGLVCPGSPASTCDPGPTDVPAPYAVLANHDDPSKLDDARQCSLPPRCESKFSSRARATSRSCTQQLLRLQYALPDLGL